MRAGRLLFLLLLTGCATTPAPPVLSYTVSLLGAGPLVIPHGVRTGGLDVGGLSALAHARGGVYYALVDGEKGTPARIFELEIRVTPDGPAVAAPRSAVRLAGLDDESFDGEGLALTRAGTFLVSSEKAPFLREVSAAGETLHLLPVPPRFAAGMRGNEAFESVGLSADGRTLWTANETALTQDAPDRDAALYGRHPVRLLRYERRGDSFAPAGELGYLVEPIGHRTDGFKVRGIVDLLPLPEGGLLALEREFAEGSGMKVQLFLVDTDGATDVSRLESLAEAGWTPVRKTLLYDFNSAFAPDNLEGMAFGPDLPDGDHRDRTLVVVSDDNFLALQSTQVVALRLHSATRGGS
ncbi:MAG: esterase-like activity of phytase family protein [Acidobacteriota bacterium]